MQLELNTTQICGIVYTSLLGISSLASSLPLKKKLTTSQKWLAFWYLLNGVIIHTFLDGLIGWLALYPPLNQQYANLDSRYPLGINYVMIISIVEMFVMTPLCLLCFHALCQNKSYFHPLQICVCAIQLMGTLVFTFSEVRDNFAHVRANGDFGLSFDAIFYFWIFFVAANILWTVLPAALILNSTKHISSQLRVAETTTKRE
eukprot:TRINITY_DN16528_c0_g1_i2.p1 TRINITY_DN16528_c0_g1~~TRINITY_DN16528_c0_g1_i2.p1  ORF type:complete len:203 (+),score=55.39 TRINITY_DN16528_c0_g1_i2:68-676(+)